jgi:DNA-binding XRE family transcriptional regulator
MAHEKVYRLVSRVLIEQPGTIANRLPGNELLLNSGNINSLKIKVSNKPLKLAKRITVDQLCFVRSMYSLSRRELALLLNVSQKTVSKWLSPSKDGKTVLPLMPYCLRIPLPKTDYPSLDVKIEQAKNKLPV